MKYFLPLFCLTMSCLTTICLAILFAGNLRAEGASVRTVSSNTRHPMAIVDAQVYVSQNLTTMRVKTFAEDLEFYHEVEADENGKYIEKELKSATREHAKFLAEKLTVLDEHGELVVPEITDIVDCEFPDGGIESGKLMEYQLGFTFEFKHASSPTFLTFQQDVGQGIALLPPVVSLTIRQSGTELKYVVNELKASQPETVRFDWDRPGISESATEEDWQKWFEEENKQTLGITSYSSVYSFIYVTDYEVRHEVLVPLASLATLVDFEREDPAFLTIAEQEKAAEQLKEYFGVGNPVNIDGTEVAPIFDRVDFYGLSLRDFAMQAEKRRVSMASGRAGLIMSYKTLGTPNKVDVTWDKFSPTITTVEAVVVAFNKVDHHQFSKYVDDNTFTWQNPGRPPITEINPIDYEPKHMSVSAISVACVGVIGLLLLSRLFLSNGLVATLLLGAASLGIGIYALPYTQFTIPIETKTVPEDQAEIIFQRLHRNLFRAFDYYDEKESYDALARSVDGDLLRKIYLDVRKSLAIKEQGGAISNIDSVRLIEGNVVEPLVDKPLTSTGFSYKSKWDITGTIEHWGHIHQRTNEYVAQFNVENRAGQWKITSMEVLSQHQGPVKTNLRKQ